MHTLIVHTEGKFIMDLAPHAISNVLAMPGTILWLDIQDPHRDRGPPAARGVRLSRWRSRMRRAHERPKVDAYEHAILQHPRGPDDELTPGDGPSAPGRQTYYFIVFYEAVPDDRTRPGADGTDQHLRRPELPGHRPPGRFEERSRTLALAGCPTALWATRSARWSMHSWMPSWTTTSRSWTRWRTVGGSRRLIFENFKQQAIQSVFSLKKVAVDHAPDRRAGGDVLNVLLR